MSLTTGAMMALGGALGGATGLAKKKNHDEYAKAAQEANNLQAATDQKIINTQSQQMAQQAQQARQGLKIQSAQKGANNEANNAATGGAQGSSVDRTANVLQLNTDKMDQGIQTNLNNKLFQQELNKLGVVNQQASANNQFNQGPDAIDVILSGITGAMQFYNKEDQ
ncbi:hypothetical protein D3C71_757980 [compost metagenome]